MGEFGDGPNRKPGTSWIKLRHNRLRSGLASTAKVLREEWSIANRTQRLEAVWREPVVSDVIAVDLLRSIGTRIQEPETLDWSRNSDEESTNTVYDMIRLCKYLRRPQVSSAWRQVVFAFFQAISQLVLLIPALRSSEIRHATLYAPPAGDPDRRTSVSEFGRLLVVHAEAITDPSLRNDASFRQLKQPVDGIDEYDSCGEYPGSIGEGLCRLHATLSFNIVPPAREKAYRTYLIVGVGGFLSLFLAPWSHLGDKALYDGVSSFLVSMTGMLVASSAMCAAIRYLLIERLNAYSLASAKTLMKATTAFLALFTLMLGLGLNDVNGSSISVVVASVMFLGVVSTTVSADHMVNVGSARLDELSDS